MPGRYQTSLYVIVLYILGLRSVNVRRHITSLCCMFQGCARPLSHVTLRHRAVCFRMWPAAIRRHLTSSCCMFRCQMLPNLIVLYVSGLCPAIIRRHLTSLCCMLRYQMLPNLIVLYVSGLGPAIIRRHLTPSCCMFQDCASPMLDVT